MPSDAQPAPASPLARALASQASEQVGDLAKARGLGGGTFRALAERAAAVLDRLGPAARPPEDDAADDPGAPLRDHARRLRAVARLIDDPGADEIPPTNAQIYEAVLDITELDAVTAGLTSLVRTQPARLLAHLTSPDAAAARRDRLALTFAALCRRAGFGPKLAHEVGGPVSFEIARWPVAAAPAVPLAPESLADACRQADGMLRALARPGLLVLEAGALLDWKPLRVAEDNAAIAVMNERLEAFMLATRDRVMDAVGDDHAFGLVVHATLPATNVASRRMLFAECVRAVNLCDADDPRIDGFASFTRAIASVG